MINWLALLKGLFSLAEYVAKICHDKQLLDAGEYKALAKANKAQLEKVRIAMAARSSSGVPDDQDPNNRDRRKL